MKKRLNKNSKDSFLKIFKSVKDVKEIGIKFGEAYIIDVFPIDPDEYLEKEVELLKLEREIFDAINEILENG